MRIIKSVTVFCGTADSVDAAYKAAAGEFGRLLAAANVRLVYGGAELGLMGTVANACLGAGGEVTGIIPDFQIEREQLNTHLSETHIVTSLAARKDMMMEKADGFVVLPGGLGTLDEAFEALTLKYIKRHDKPIVFLNTNGFYAPFLGMIDHMIQTGFSATWHRGLFAAVETPAEILPALQTG